MSHFIARSKLCDVIFVLSQTEADEELSGLGFESDEAEGVDDGDWSDWRGDLSGAVCLFW